MYALKYSSSSLLILLLFVFNSCHDGHDNGPKKKKGVLDCKYFGVDQDGDFRIEKDCSGLQGFIMDLGDDTGYKKALTIRGYDAKTNKGIIIGLYFNDEYSLSSGNFPAFTENLGVDPYFTAQIMTEKVDINDPLKGVYAIPIGENSEGNLKISKFDQTNNLISGQFSFKGQNIETQKTVTVTGSFEDIIVFPSLEEANKCYGGPDTSIPTPANPETPGTGTPGTGGSSSMSFINNSFTMIEITVNGSVQNVVAGGSANFQGQPNTTVAIHAETSGKTLQGDRVGLLMEWNLNLTFPASGTDYHNLDIGSNFFFLKIKNTSSKPANKLYVNYGLQSQTLDNVVIENDQKIYSLGYYKAFSNSNVRLENGNSFWSFPQLNLPSSINQTIILELTN